MNKRVLTEELRKIGISIETLEFSTQGYTLDLKLDVNKSNGWEDLEYLPISGIEIAKFRTTGAYTRRVQIIPNSRKEFIDYVRKHMKYFCAGKTCALYDLQAMIDRLGSRNAKNAVTEYLKTEQNYRIY